MISMTNRNPFNQSQFPNEVMKKVLSQKYSKNLGEIIIKMIQVDSSKRISLKELLCDNYFQEFHEKEKIKQLPNEFQNEELKSTIDKQKNQIEKLCDDIKNNKNESIKIEKKKDKIIEELLKKNQSDAENLNNQIDKLNQEIEELNSDLAKAKFEKDGINTKPKSKFEKRDSVYSGIKINTNEDSDKKDDERSHQRRHSYQISDKALTPTLKNTSHFGKDKQDGSPSTKSGFNNKKKEGLISDKDGLIDMIKSKRYPCIYCQKDRYYCKNSNCKAKDYWCTKCW